MAKRPFRVPLPHAGVNADAALTGLDANEAPYLLDTIINEPGHIRPRGRHVVSRNFATSITNWPSDVPLGSMSLGDVMLTSWMPRASYALLSHTSTRRSATDAYVEPAFSWYAIFDDRDGVITKATDPDITRHIPYGATAAYDGRVYGISTGQGGSSSPNWATSSMIDAGPAPRLTCWGGAIRQFSVATQVTLNNGSDTGTFTSSIPASSMVGMFITDRPTALPDLAPTTGRAPSFGFSYTYRIIAHVGGAATFTIDRPFGLGATATQVPNLTLANVTLNAFTTIPLSPSHLGHVEVHRDRIFVGQLLSTVRTPGVPYGVSVNTIAWSDPGDPSKWRSSNLVQVDDRSDEAITGMVSVANGQMLLIFKPTRTLALVGDSEDNFEIRNLSNSYGCVDSRGIVAVDSGAVFPSERGIVEFDGVRFREITTTRPGHGVRSAYLEALNGETLITSLTKPRRRRVAAAHTQDDFLLFSIQNDDTIGLISEEATGVRNMFAYHRPTRSWTYWAPPMSGTVDYDGQRTSVFEHFTTYADQPNRVHAARGDGGLYRVDQMFSPAFEADLTTSSLTNLANGISWQDQRILNGTGTLGATFSPSVWVSPIFMPADGDEVHLTDAVLEFMRYEETVSPDVFTPASSGNDTLVWIRPDVYLAGNRGGLAPNTGAVESAPAFVLPRSAVAGRGGGDSVTPWRDQRFMREKLVLDSVSGTHTLNMNCSSFQVAVEFQRIGVGNRNHGTRIYGLRMMLDGPTIAPGYDK